MYDGTRTFFMKESAEKLIERLYNSEEVKDVWLITNRDGFGQNRYTVAWNYKEEAQA